MNKSMRARVEKMFRTKLWDPKKMSPKAWAIGGAVMFAFVIAIIASGMWRASHSEPAPTAASIRTDGAPAAPSAPIDSTGNGSKDGQHKPSIVTITGCLERDHEEFKLKDTSGADAPRSRSWKSGFLKKGPAAIQVVDASNRARLPEHVGRRVSVTGVLVDKEMQVRSLLRVAPTCKAPKA